MARFKVYKNRKKLGQIEAESLDDAVRVASKKWATWTDLYITTQKDKK